MFVPQPGILSEHLVAGGFGHCEISMMLTSRPESSSHTIVVVRAVWLN
jgi:hypothetical protein